MKNTTQYVGYTKEDDIMHMMIVDLLDLPHDMFSAEKPLHIDADVNMGKGKKAPLPDFSNVIIKGVFDCSDFTISKDSVLPKGITEIICLHSISNLSVLIGKLPKTVTKVVVRPSVLNAVIKNKNNELEIAKQFADTYPNIQVTDDKKLYLSEIIQQKEKPTVTEKVKAQKTETKEKTQLSSKTDDWLSMDEIFEICVTNPAITNLIPEDKIEREIRAAKSKASYIDVTVQKMLRPHDGIAIDCIHSNDVQKIINFIIEKANDRASKQQTEKVKKESKKQPKQPVEQQTIQQPKLYVGTKEVQPIVIKKYIKKNIWDLIKKHCGKTNYAKQLSFLRDIEQINIQPISTQGDSVCYIQDGTTRKSINVFLKNSKCLTQRYDKTDERPRTIWYMKGDTFIASEYFADHELSQEYFHAICIDNLSGINTQDTILVSKLITSVEKALKKQKETVAKVQPKETTIPVVPNVKKSLPNTEVPTTQKIAEPAKVQETKPVETLVNKRVRHRFTIEPKPLDLSNIRVEKYNIQIELLDTAEELMRSEKYECRKIADDIASDIVTSISDCIIESMTEPDNVPEPKSTTFEWKDVDSLHATLTVKLNELNRSYCDIVKLLTAETETEKSLEYTAELRNVLEQKQKFERALKKLNQFKLEIEALRQDFLKQM